ncbi:MAG: nucleotidyltransferase family protein, partial [Xanthobacteraceae bacterium]
MELLPPRIRNPALRALIGDILKPDTELAGVSALRLRLMDPGFSWQALIDLATQHDLLPPLIHALSERALLPPVPHAPRNGHVTPRLRQYYREHLARRELQRTQIENVLRHFNRAGIVPLILKGARYVVAPV